MRKNWFLLACTVLTCAVLPQIVLADEVWTTEEYDVIYQEDRCETAIWSYGDNGIVFIDGLAGVFTGRGSYTGYWAQTSSSQRCDTFREGPDGEPTYYWGRFEVMFLDPDFPSRWHAHAGLCNQEPTMFFNGTPVTSSQQ